MAKNPKKPAAPQSEPRAAPAAGSPESLAPETSHGNVFAVAELHAKAESEVDQHQRRIEALTAALGRPRTLYALLIGVALWVTYNLVAPLLRLPRFDPPPFIWLEGVVGLMSLLMTTMVLITQNRQGKLAARRALLDLHVNLMSEKKAAKLIALIEELRRDMPSVDNRHDPQAEVMSQPMDPHSTIAKLEASIEKAINLQGNPAESGEPDAGAADGLGAQATEVAREAAADALPPKPE